MPEFLETLFTHPRKFGSYSLFDKLKHVLETPDASAEIFNPAKQRDKILKLNGLFLTNVNYNIDF